MARHTSSVLALLGLTLLSFGVAQEQCQTPSFDVKTSSLVQKAVVQSQVRITAEEDVGQSLRAAQPTIIERTNAADARFLMQASFGPTRSSLASLQGLTYESWIHQQTQLRVESHREYYRQRVNPYFDRLSEAVGSPRGPCVQGSRWHNYAFTFKDVGKRIAVEGSRRILIDGDFRTDVESASSWVGLTNFTGYICYVAEKVGSDVHVSREPDCRQEKRVMPNPAMWLSSGGIDVAWSFSSPKPGVLILQESPASCSLSGSHPTSRYAGNYYRYDSRLELLDNTPESPLGATAACVPMTPLNEHQCRLATTSADTTVVAGLKAEVYEMDLPEYISTSFSGRLLAEVVDPLVNHSAGQDAWPGFPSVKYEYAVRWTGSITIQQSGIYEFWITSDDGSRLTIDDQLLIRNDGTHSMVEKHGNLTLSAGSHAVVIEFFQHGGGRGMIFHWKGPDSANTKVVVPSSVLSTPRPSWSGCFIKCGSPGEVANDPALGHQLPMWTSGDSASRDVDYDSRYFDRMGSELAKSTVWTMKALGAHDQLRQRTAWALSQIFVVSTQGFGDNHLSEIWLNYYDIFLRNAFGNFRSLLREVTFSPLMGKYLTHTGSSSFQHNQRYPNENYAREVMQLFTIGLDMLNSDGSVQQDASGNDIPTYSNKHILNFARVFTGFVEQPARANIEYRSSSNLIDPLKMAVEKHDVYPKPDLDANYIGDGQPLCTDRGFAGAFLAKGARYEFRGPHGPSNALVLSPSSALYGALCDASDASECTHAALVHLPQTLQCTGEECELDFVRYVKVGGAYYEYVPQSCVHLFFREPTRNATAEVAAAPVAQAGYCLDAAGNWLGGAKKLDSLDEGDTPERREQCLAACRNAGGTGCMLVWSRGNRGCYAHMYPVVGASGSDRYQCWSFNDPGLVGHSYMLLNRNTLCPAGTAITSIEECRQALQTLGLSPDRPWIQNPDSTNYPHACSWSGNMIWSTAPQGNPKSWVAPVCRAHIILDRDGDLVQADGSTKFAPLWLGSAPAPGIHSVLVRTRPAFDRIPSRTELMARLRVDALPPRQDCSSCDGEVKAYHRGSSAMSAETVFELDGQFFANTESVILTMDGQKLFRNPPIFMRSTDEAGAERAALAEVESLLDHLFYHSNTPIFIGKRLIQRFVTSNPSPQYLQAVGQAFRSGRYGEMPFSGNYGDLAATVAAVLLHPEARGQSGNSTVEGALREPVLKFIHVMRSMEYKDRQEGPVVFRELQDLIGQFPHQSPTVFNFYTADFELPMSEPEPEPEPEPEAEPEPEPEPEPESPPPVAPEFQIFTPPYFMGYLNGMSSLIKNGVSGACDSGSGLGIRVNDITDGTWRDVCPQGTLTWQGRDTMNETLEELDVLLTGGRLTPVAKEVVQSAYEQAPKWEKLQAAQQAIVMTAEFNTLGSPLPQEGPRVSNPGSQKPAQKPYKAAVMLFLSGGADTFNMLVPQDCPLYQEYVDMRTDLAMSPGELIPIQTSGQVCGKFGIHGRLSFLKGLYDRGQAAFVSNVGSLVEPTTLQQFKTGQRQQCFGLFSHSDQQNAAQTLKCQELGSSARGAGGRVADSLAAGPQQFSTTSFSLAGTAIWPQGVATQREIVDQRGTVGFSEFERWRGAIGNITAQRHGNVYSEAYAKAFLQSIETTQNLGRALDGVELLTDYSTQTGLQRELEQVAKLIRAREGRGAERDFFFVSIGGWDMHDNMKARLNDRLQELDHALRGFVAEMEAQGVWGSVVLATESEFGRTLDSNGGGSDHAWAGNQFIMSGDLRGQRVFNKFPASLSPGNDRDLGRGRLIPDYPWESMMVPIAEWMGLEPSQRADAFPNIGYFNTSHIIAKSDLFMS